jgi:hypothetical protein
MNNFKNLKVWQKGFDIAVHAFKLADTLPKEQNLGLVFKLRELLFLSLPISLREAVAVV